MRAAALTVTGWALLAACASATATPSTATPPPTPTVSPTLAASATVPSTATASPVLAGPRRFVIVPEGTTARFRVQEVLRGKPNVVIGKTDQVRGDLTLDPEAPSQVAVGPIVIQAGSFVTDNELRDSSIRGLILEAAVYPEIVFAPTAVVGLPERVEVGDRLTFDVTGDLTIRAVTRAETFRVTVEVASADRLKGTATATIQRADYGLNIPSVPFVAQVGEDVELSLGFTALDAESAPE